MEAKAEARRAYAEAKEEKDNSATHDYDSCGPGFIWRRYSHLWWKRGVDDRMIDMIKKLDRPMAIGRLIVKTLRRADFNVYIHEDLGATIGELLKKVPMLWHLDVTAKEIYDLPLTEKRYAITYPRDVAGSYVKQSDQITPSAQ